MVAKGFPENNRCFLVKRMYLPDVVHLDHSSVVTVQLSLYLSHHSIALYLTFLLRCKSYRTQHHHFRCLQSYVDCEPLTFSHSSKYLMSMCFLSNTPCISYSSLYIIVIYNPMVLFLLDILVVFELYFLFFSFISFRSRWPCWFLKSLKFFILFVFFELIQVLVVVLILHFL